MNSRSCELPNGDELWSLDNEKKITEADLRQKPSMIISDVATVSTRHHMVSSKTIESYYPLIPLDILMNVFGGY